MVKEKGSRISRKRLAQSRTSTRIQLTAQQERDKLAAKIAEFEKRKYLTRNRKRYGDLEKQAKTLQAELEARDYRTSTEYKESTKEMAIVYANAVEDIKTLSVSEGEDQSRPAPRGFQPDTDRQPGGFPEVGQGNVRGRRRRGH